MSKDSTQQKLDDSASDVEEDSKTVQERIIALYVSEKLLSTFIGFGAKLAIEFGIVAVWGIAVILTPGAILAYLNIGPFTYVGALGVWIAFSTTVGGFTWCFTAITGISEDETSGQGGSDD